MNAYDLRIGNWVHYMMHDHSLSCKLVTGIYSLRQVELSSMGQPVSLSCALAIPLTPEILKNCGFKMSITKTCFGLITDDGKLRLSIFSDGRFKVGTEDIVTKVQYLHQLQNLYYSLTGVELEVKL